jgi:hypothetical protein
MLPNKQNPMFRNNIPQCVVSSCRSIINTYSIILSPLNQSYVLFNYHEDTTLFQIKTWWCLVHRFLCRNRVLHETQFIPLFTLSLSFNIVPHKLNILYGSAINVIETILGGKVGDCWHFLTSSLKVDLESILSNVNKKCQGCSNSVLIDIILQAHRITIVV